MQGTQFQSLVREDPICYGVTKPLLHNYSYWAHVRNCRSPCTREPVLCNKRSHCSEKPTHCNQRKARTNIIKVCLEGDWGVRTGESLNILSRFGPCACIFLFKNRYRISYKASLLFFLNMYLAGLRSNRRILWLLYEDLSSLTRDRTLAPCIGCVES